VRFGVALARTRPELWPEVATAADELGFESVWVSDHLVFPIAMAGSPHDLAAGEEAHPPVPPTTPVFEPGAVLSFLAARTRRVRLGTFVHLLGIRHPFVSARTFATADVLSAGRVEVGVGAGWLRSEWVAAGLDPASRGRRLDEAIEVCRRLWTEPEVAHRGEFWRWDAVAFEPKPPQRPPPILVGGESGAALRRAARLGDGWIGMNHDPTGAADRVRALRAAEVAVGRVGPATTVTLGGEIGSDADIDRYTSAGVDRLVVAPWTRVRDTVDALEAFARRHL
jgi:probable F420-dependent oxidoreductase